MNRPDITVGTILTNSIGSGHDFFYQVISRSPKSVTARKLQYKITNRSVKWQSMDISPIPNDFCEPKIRRKYIGGYMKGESKFKDVDENTIKLKLSDNGQIGPSVRLEWWSVYNGKELNQFSM